MMTFKAKVRPALKTVTYIEMPKSILKKLGTKARVPVKIQLKGHVFRTSFSPMDGRHMMIINREMKARTGIKVGDTLTVRFEVDKAKRTVRMPEELRKKLTAVLCKHFSSLSYTRRKELVRSITEAKRPETRQQRLAKVIRELKRLSP